MRFPLSLFIIVVLIETMPSKHDWIRFGTEFDNCQKIIMVRHPKQAGCFLCVDLWRKRFYVNFMKRAHNVRTLNNISFWTLGTSLIDSKANRIAIQYLWNKFRASMNKYSNWEPVVKVVESGSIGKRLHIHFLSLNWIKHEIVLRHWRRITQERANVHVLKIVNNVRTQLNYLIKYVSKDTGRYSWLGQFRMKAQKENQSTMHQCEHGAEYIYDGLIYQWDGMRDESLYSYNVRTL